MALFAWWRYEALEKWVVADSATLAPYPTELFPGHSAELDSKDECLVDSLGKDRVMLRLTRSEFRPAPFGGQELVKVHLVTGKPGSDAVQTPIKLLVTMERQESRWAVDEVREIALP